MARYGKNVVLVRDLTDTMYNSRSWPYVSHFEGTDRIVEHIEKYVCPTITSTDLTGQPAVPFQPDDRPRAVFLIGEDEYKTETTLPAFASQGARAAGRALHVRDRRPEDAPRLPGHRGPGRRRPAGRERPPPRPTAEQMAIIRKYVESGKPLVGIRTACHAFDARGKAPAGHAEWTTFDPDVLGGHYTGHHANDLKPEIELGHGRREPPDPRGRRDAVHQPGLALQDQPAGRLGPAPADGHDPRPAGRAGGLGQSRRARRASSTRRSGHPGDFDEPVVPPAAPQRRLLGTQPPAASQAIDQDGSRSKTAATCAGESPPF